jgi:hypothetical protein
MKLRKTGMIAVVLLTALSVFAFAQTEADFAVELTKDGKGVIITKYNGQEKEVRIPATIQGMPVKELGKEAFKVSICTSVVIPTGVTTIGVECFQSSWNLVSVTIPDTVTIIDSDAFAMCNKLESLALPPKLTKISTGLLSGTNLKSVVIPEGVTEIGATAFTGVPITSINLPAALKRMNSFVFALGGGANLTNIIIPASLKKVEFDSDAFNGCSKLPLAVQASLKKLGYTGSF